jgi:hypothetical protein
MAAMTVGGTPEERTSTIYGLHEEHQGAGFPARFRDEEPSGVDLALLDAGIAGCVTTWQHGGRLDTAQREVLHECLHDLDRVLSRLTDGSERQYVERLRELARLLAQAGG